MYTHTHTHTRTHTHKHTHTHTHTHRDTYHDVDNVADVVGVARHLGWDKYSLLGHSLGGCVAQAVAATVPEQVQRLVVIEALGWFSHDGAGALAAIRKKCLEVVGTNSKQVLCVCVCVCERERERERERESVCVCVCIHTLTHTNLHTHTAGVDYLSRY